MADQRSGLLRACVALAAFVVVVCAGETRSFAAELVMFERPGCVWCERWNAEVGTIYPKTRESCLAPLRRVDILQPMPEDLREIVHGGLTPTFVLVDGGVEIGRIRGYPGEAFFWSLLDELLARPGAAKSPDNGC